MRLNLGATMPFPEKFLHNKRDTMSKTCPQPFTEGENTSF